MTIIPTPGTSIEVSADQAIRIAKLLGDKDFVILKHNESSFSISSHTHPTWVVSTYYDMKPVLYMSDQREEQQ